MSVLNWVHSGEVVALGWTLLHFCWQSAIVALLYALMDRCLFRATTAVRYGVAMTMLGLMPLAAIATFIEQERLVVHLDQGQQTFVASQIGSLHTTIAMEAPFVAPAMADSELWIAWHADRLMPWIDGVWLAGVCFLALRAAGGWWRLRSLRRSAQVPVPAVLQRSFAKVVGQLRLAQPVVLRVSRDVISPMAMGIWRTSVILPLSVATSLPAEQLEAVLAHELAHIRRWDYFCNLLQTAIECLFFFHPAVWWMSRRTRELREVCCDEIAARTCADPGIYAEALLQMEEQRAEHLQLAVALHGKGGTLLNRIRRVMGEGTMEYGSMSVVRVAAACLVVTGLAVAPHVAKGLKAEPAGVSVVAGEKVAPIQMPPAASGSVAVVLPASRNERAGVEVSQAVSAPAPAPVPAPAAVPVAAAAPAPTAVPAPAALPHPMPRDEEMQDAENASGKDYLQKMRDAGYPLDLNKDLDTIFSLRSVGVTPEYAKAMAQAGLGTPTLKELVSLKSVGVTPEYVSGLKGSNAAPTNFKEVISEKAVGVTPEYAKAMAATGLGTPTMHDLVAMKAQGITPEYVAQMKAGGITPESLHELISLRSVGVTPEYAKAMAAAGMGTPTTHDLVAMKAQGITPEYVAQLKAGGLAPADLHELITFRAVGVTPEYAKAMAATGFQGLSTHDLVSLKAQGVTPEYVRWIKTTFPNASLHEVHQAAVFHIDQEFMNKAKAHSFNSTDLDKLVKLKMTGLLN
jgi:beta-lactamase regulating signal transducer with metallopeptidase domain